MRRECQCLGEAGPPLTPGACSAQLDRQLRGLQGGSRIPPASPKEASPWEWTQLNGFSGGHLASPAGLSLFLSIEADVPRVFLAGFSPRGGALDTAVPGGVAVQMLLGCPCS